MEKKIIALVLMATTEIVSEKSISSDWQDSACRLLIALAAFVPDIVAKQLLSRFPSNNAPHYFVVKACFFGYFFLIFFSTEKLVLIKIK